MLSSLLGPDDEESKKLAPTFRVSNIISAFSQHQWYQQGLDKEAKGEMGTKAGPAKP